MGGWGCPHEVDGECRQVPDRECDPGRKGCVLHGKVTFSKDSKNSPRIRRRQAARGQGSDSGGRS